MPNIKFRLIRRKPRTNERAVREYEIADNLTAAQAQVLINWAAQQVTYDMCAGTSSEYLPTPEEAVENLMRWLAKKGV